MFELIQGLRFLINKKKMGKEPFTSNLDEDVGEESDIKRLETKFNQELEKYTKMYKTYADGMSQMTPEDEKLVKTNIERANAELMSIVDELYAKITEMNKGRTEEKKAGKGSQKSDITSAKKSLQALEGTKALYHDLSDPKKTASFDAFEEDFKLKAEMERVRYIMWASLAIIVFVSAIVWLVMSVEFPKPVKIGIVSSTVLVALGFLSAIWAVAIKYCQQASKKGIICAIVYFLDKFFKGVIDFLSTII